MSSNLLTSATFDNLQLAEPILRAVRAEDYSLPTPIQAQAIPHLLKGRDLLGSAQTGTGKTAAFALPILHQLENKRQPAISGAPQVLVLSPTRELAVQISESFQTYGQFVRFRQTVVYGGVHQNAQVRALKRGVHLVVATPGRLIDLMEQGHIQLDRLRTFVLDEADRMLDMGFLPALKRIIKDLPVERQSLFFSATLPPKIIDLAQTLLNDPVRVNVVPKSTSIEKIEQRVLFVEHGGKREVLEGVLRGEDVERALVFTKTKRTANVLAEKLIRRGIKATAIHGNKTQAARQRALDAFRRKQVQVLVATDVAARGIDIDGITHVVNYDLPLEPESYVHRIGRTGRAGADGVALSFCTPEERGDLRAIERLIGRRLLMADGQPQPMAPPVGNPQETAKQPSSAPKKSRRPWSRERGSSNGSGQANGLKKKRQRPKAAPVGTRFKSKG
jgi:ATP-dependent RNA helicase RhlE